MVGESRPWRSRSAEGKGKSMGREGEDEEFWVGERIRNIRTPVYTTIPITPARIGASRICVHKRVGRKR